MKTIRIWFLTQRLRAAHAAYRKALSEYVAGSIERLHTRRNILDHAYNQREAEGPMHGLVHLMS